MSQQNLNADLVKDILIHLGCPLRAPTLRYLNRLIHAYICKVPWESVSRIIKRYTTLETKDCPRLPAEFWNDAKEYGFGGTCFESSLAFYSLLTVLGYEGYLTVNDMGTTRGCHAAIVLLLNGEKYLVDITIPVHAAVRLDPQKVVRRWTPFHNYTIRPVHGNKYEVQRSHHSNRNAFTLIDIPVSLTDYQIILENDYTETGFFLKSVVIVKVMGNKTLRFFSDHKPYKLESFNRAGKRETIIGSEILPYLLAGLFKLPEDKISAAFAWIQSPPTAYCTVPDLLQERSRQHA